MLALLTATVLGGLLCAFTNPTVLHACRRIAALCDEDPLFKQEVDFLKQVLSRTVQ